MFCGSILNFAITFLITSHYLVVVNGGGVNEDVCVWCNEEMMNDYTNCLFSKLASSSIFDDIPKDIVNDMDISLKTAAGSMMKTPDRIKMRIMTGALAGEISGMILSSNEKPDVATLEAMKLAQECYTSLTGESKANFVSALGRSINDAIQDDIPDDSIDVTSAYTSVQTVNEPNNNFNQPLAINTNQQDQQQYVPNPLAFLQPPVKTAPLQTPSVENGISIPINQPFAINSNQQDQQQYVLNPLVFLQPPVQTAPLQTPTLENGNSITITPNFNNFGTSNSEQSGNSNIPNINFKQPAVLNDPQVQQQYQSAPIFNNGFSNQFTPNGNAFETPQNGFFNSPPLQQTADNAVASASVAGASSSSFPLNQNDFRPGNSFPTFSNGYSAPNFDKPSRNYNYPSNNPIDYININIGPGQYDPLVPPITTSNNNPIISQNDNLNNPDLVPPPNLNFADTQLGLNQNFPGPLFGSPIETNGGGSAYGNEQLSNFQSFEVPTSVQSINSYTPNFNLNPPTVLNDPQAQQPYQSAQIFNNGFSNQFTPNGNTFETPQNGFFNSPALQQTADNAVASASAIGASSSSFPINQNYYTPENSFLTFPKGYNAPNFDKPIGNYDYPLNGQKDNINIELEQYDPVVLPKSANNNAPIIPQQDYLNIPNLNSAGSQLEPNQNFPGPLLGSALETGNDNQQTMSDPKFINLSLSPPSSVAVTSDASTQPLLNNDGNSAPEPNDAFQISVNTANSEALSQLPIEPQVPNGGSPVISNNLGFNKPGKSTITPFISTSPKPTTTLVPSTTPQLVTSTDNPKSCAMKFGEALFVHLLKDERFSCVFGKETPHDLAVSVGSETVQNALTNYGLSEYADNAAKYTSRQINLLPVGASTQAYGEKISKSVMTTLYRNHLLNGDCEATARSISSNILNTLPIIYDKQAQSTDDLPSSAVADNAALDPLLPKTATANAAAVSDSTGPDPSLPNTATAISYSTESDPSLPNTATANAAAVSDSTGPDPSLPNTATAISYGIESDPSLPNTATANAAAVSDSTGPYPSLPNTATAISYSTGSDPSLPNPATSNVVAISAPDIPNDTSNADVKSTSGVSAPKMPSFKTINIKPSLSPSTQSKSDSGLAQNYPPSVDDEECDDDQNQNTDVQDPLALSRPNPFSPNIRNNAQLQSNNQNSNQFPFSPINQGANPLPNLENIGTPNIQQRPRITFPFPRIGIPSNGKPSPPSNISPNTSPDIVTAEAQTQSSIKPQESNPGAGILSNLGNRGTPQNTQQELEAASDNNGSPLQNSLLDVENEECDDDLEQAPGFPDPGIQSTPNLFSLSTGNNAVPQSLNQNSNRFLFGPTNQGKNPLSNFGSIEAPSSIQQEPTNIIQFPFLRMPSNSNLAPQTYIDPNTATAEAQSSIQPEEPNESAIGTNGQDKKPLFSFLSFLKPYNKLNPKPGNEAPGNSGNTAPGPNEQPNSPLNIAIGEAQSTEPQISNEDNSETKKPPFFFRPFLRPSNPLFVKPGNGEPDNSGNTAPGPNEQPNALISIATAEAQSTDPQISNEDNGQPKNPPFSFLPFLRSSNPFLLKPGNAEPDNSGNTAPGPNEQPNAPESIAISEVQSTEPQISNEDNGQPKKPPFSFLPFLRPSNPFFPKPGNGEPDNSGNIAPGPNEQPNAPVSIAITEAQSTEPQISNEDNGQTKKSPFSFLSFLRPSNPLFLKPGNGEPVNSDTTALGPNEQPNAPPSITISEIQNVQPQIDNKGNAQNKNPPFNFLPFLKPSPLLSQDQNSNSPQEFIPDTQNPLANEGNNNDSNNLQDITNNPFSDTLSDPESQQQIQALMKSGLDSISNTGFNYKNFISTMSDIVSELKNNHPDWSPVRSLLKMDFEAIVALSQDLQNVATGYSMQQNSASASSVAEISQPISLIGNPQITAASANSASLPATSPEIIPPAPIVYQQDNSFVPVQTASASVSSEGFNNRK